jgi:hypothetical protein
MPDGYSAVLAAQQPDGTFKTRYFKTISEYDAAVAAMGGSSASPTTTITNGSAPSSAPALLP